MSPQVEARPAWHAVVLAASRPGDPLCRAFGVGHKCLLPVAGEPMLARVVRALARHRAIARIVVVIEDGTPVATALGSLYRRVEIVRARETAAASAAAAIAAARFDGPVLVTTADHALLDKAMLDHFMAASEASGADVTAGLARAETILSRYPEAKRTFLRLGGDRISGCNLYGFLTPRGHKAIAFWERIEANRKRPLMLVAAFGLMPLLRFLTGTLNLETAFRLASGRIGVVARPVVMPMPEAAIDVDKPEDKTLVDEILARRWSAGSPPPQAGELLNPPKRAYQPSRL